jgi:hypothetical protein
MRPRALWSAVIVYLVIGVPVARLWHEVTAVHRYCALHGAIEEAPEHAPAAPDTDPARPDQGGQGGGDPQHESCPFTPLGGQMAVAPTQAWLEAAVAPPAAAPGLSVSRPPAIPSAVLSLAPKTSPPA